MITLRATDQCLGSPYTDLLDTFLGDNHDRKGQQSNNRSAGPAAAPQSTLTSYPSSLILGNSYLHRSHGPEDTRLRS